MTNNTKIKDEFMEECQKEIGYISAIFIGISLLLFLISYWWLAFQKLGEIGIDTRNQEKISQQAIKRQITQDNMVQENSLVSVSSLPFDKPIILSSIISEVIECESGWDNSARGRHGEIGLCQFKEQTWDWMCGLADFDGDIYSKEDQIWLIDWAFRNNLARHWTCYNQIK